MNCCINNCSVSCVNIKLLLKHIRRCHQRNDYKNGFICKIFGCGKYSTSYDAYRKHCERHHNPSPISIHELSSTSCSRPLGRSDDTDVHGISPSNSSKNNDTNSHEIQVSGTNMCKDNTNTESFLKTFRLFCLQCREAYFLPKSVFTEIMDHFVDLIELFNSLSPDERGTVDISDIWRRMKNEQNYTQFCLDIGMVKATEIIFNNNKFHYIPVYETLKQYLAHPDVLSVIKHNSNISSSDLVFHNFTDGFGFKNNSFFQGNHNLLQLQLYCDEVEVCNPLGSAKKTHKLFCMYFSLGNMGSKYLSDLKHIHILIIAKSSVVREIGYDNLLKKLVDDLIKLEDVGIQIQLQSGELITFFAGVSIISADNLGSHEIGGFRRCFSSGRICRFCMAMHSDLKHKTSECEFTLRTKENHDFHVLSVLNDSSLACVYGVSNECVLSKCRSFNSIDSLPPDIMHDVMEGIIPKTLQLILDKLNCLNILSTPKCKGIFKTFKYGVTDRCNIPHAGVQAMTASQAWCLFRLFPLMIGEIVPTNSEVWELYILLAQICSIIMAPVIESDWVSYLDVLVTEFYHLYLSLDGHVTPKFHFLLHYPYLITKFGPLRNVWCMRFEAYHQRIKKIAKRSNNFKNLTYTVSSRLQFLKSWELSSNLCLNSSDCRNVDLVTLLQMPSQVRSYFITKGVELGEEIEVTEMFGSTIKVGAIYVLDFQNEMPVFIKIRHLICHNKEKYYSGKLIQSVQFLRHYQCFEVKLTDMWYNDNMMNFFYNHALDLYAKNEKLLIRLRYNITLKK